MRTLAYRLKAGMYNNTVNTFETLPLFGVSIYILHKCVWIQCDAVASKLLKGALEWELY